MPLIDKKAVSVGKGLTHRLSLDDGILIKNNHLKLLGNNIKKALRLALKNKSKYIEIEVRNEKQALEAAKTISKLKSKKLFAIMFDNTKASTIKESIKKINSKYNKKKILFEASGGINLDNIEKYSKTGVDVISLGYITHSAKALDMSLKIR